MRLFIQQFEIDVYNLLISFVFGMNIVKYANYIFLFTYIYIYVYWYTNVPETFINILVYRMHASIHTIKKVFIFKGKNITIMYFGIAIWYIRLKRLYICIIRV